MRALLAAAALLAALPAQAQDASEWDGVWEGRVGTFPVRLCYDSQGGGPGLGSYYYLSRLEPIVLSPQESEGGLTELAADGESQALWAFAERTGTRMRGTWHQGNRRLAFDLRPVEWDREAAEGPCGSLAFFEPRLPGGEVQYEEGLEFEGLRYARAFYRPPPHFAEDVRIETFLFDAEMPGDPAINAELSARLPSGAWEDPYLECLAANLSATGRDGFFEETLRPTMVSSAYLAVEETSSTYCGGAHPNYYTLARTFDRRTGDEVDLADWIGEPAGEGQAPGLPDRLRALILARWPEDVADCREFAQETDYWSLGLAHEGMVFRPDFPHAMTACEEPVTVEWQALEPFLDSEGRQGLTRLRTPSAE